MSIAIPLHVLAAIVWVGGMFFAYLALRPAAAQLEAPQRLALWAEVLRRFFAWVWLAALLLLGSGLWMVFGAFGGMGGVGPHVHAMLLLGVIMMMLYAHVYFAPYRRLARAVAAADWAAAGASLAQIRRLVAVNLTLGLLVSAIGSGGRFL